MIGIPDQGVHIKIDDCELVALPTHFMHAEGNFQFYDPISKILRLWHRLDDRGQLRSALIGFAPFGQA